MACLVFHPRHAKVGDTTPNLTGCARTPTQVQKALPATNHLKKISSTKSYDHSWH